MTLFTVFLLWENARNSRLRFLCLGTKIGIGLSRAAVTDLSLSPWQSHVEKRKQKFIAQNYWQRTLMSIFIVINLYRGSLNIVCVIVVWHWSVFWYGRVFFVLFFCSRHVMLRDWDLKHLPKVWDFFFFFKNLIHESCFCALAAVSHQSKITVQFTDCMLWIIDKLSNFCQLCCWKTAADPLLSIICAWVRLEGPEHS